MRAWFHNSCGWWPFSISQLAQQVHPFEASTATMSDPATLFSHSIGHCKDVWTPIIKRIYETIPGAVECTSFSFPFHGERGDPKADPVTLSDGPDMPRLHHPAGGDQEMLIDTIMTEVKHLRRSNATRPIIGVGHSMGSIALWITEITYPGTFHGLCCSSPSTISLDPCNKQQPRS